MIGKCSICGEDAVGMTQTVRESFHFIPMVYEFRCKKHLEDYDVKTIPWTDIKGIGYD
ncbi:unnamed protein product [marine sediment metagenome]|uniref:Uncharacterized protein n=1 Tax=marine sediment metagenome TaxID=412755 RepID=X1C9N4_9ZZZZ